MAAPAENFILWVYAEGKKWSKVVLARRPDDVFDLVVAILTARRWAVDEHGLVQLRLLPMDPMSDDLPRAIPLLEQLPELTASWRLSRDLSTLPHVAGKDFADQYIAGLPSGARVVVVLPEAVPVQLGMADLRQVVAALLDERSFFDKIDPFAHSHHTEAMSVHSPPGSVRFPPDRERSTFKKTVIEYYGLQTGVESKVCTMLGEVVDFKDAELAHIWPRSYTNWGDVGPVLALPAEFYKDPRNFLIIPHSLHVSFDSGQVIFTPAKENGNMEVYIHYIRDDGVEAPRKMVFRNERRPYCRLLAFFGLMAKKTRNISDAATAALRKAVDFATEDTEGRRLCLDFAKRLHAAQYTTDLDV